MTERVCTAFIKQNLIDSALTIFARSFTWFLHSVSSFMFTRSVCKAVFRAVFDGMSGFLIKRILLMKQILEES